MEPLKVVITGASGFLGGCVLRALAAQQHVEAIAVTRKEIPGWHKVRDYSQSPEGDILIHLAEDGDRARVAKSGLAYEEEVLSTLDALLAKGYRKVIYASSGVLYGDADIQAHFSNDPIRTDDAYALVKRQSELAVLKLQSGIVVRLANIYGPGMSKNNVMSTILRQIPGEGALEVMVTSPVRDFIWVEDAAEGIVALALNKVKDGVESGLYNLGTGVGTSIGALASLALEIAGQPDRPVQAKYSPGQQSSIILNFSETTSACGWRPKTSLRQGLARMLNNNEGII
jgi:nucleoside-diphosphate-sugar epimerase